VMVTFDVPADLREVYRYRAGQHVVVLHDHEGVEVRRLYSICSSEADQLLRIAVRRLPGGVFSTYASHHLRVGDALRVMSPLGRFGVAVDSKRSLQYGAVAAGSGITPIFSILATILDTEPLSSVVLLYQNRTRQSSMFLSDLDELQTRHAGRLDVRHYWSRAADSRRLTQDELARLVREDHQVGRIQQWFLCGPVPLMEQATIALERHGLDAARIRRELFFDDGADLVSRYGASERPQLTSAVTVRLGGVESSFALSSNGGTILDAALDAGVDVPYSCKNGVCTTCRARLVAGAVEMDRCSGLDRAERAAGYVLTCQAHPVSLQVVVDFDT
jgi:ring-1,2-phenylacetyl-CoA epoxidase subunit PaaE